VALEGLRVRAWDLGEIWQPPFEFTGCFFKPDVDKLDLVWTMEVQCLWLLHMVLPDCEKYANPWDQAARKADIQNLDNGVYDYFTAHRQT